MNSFWENIHFLSTILTFLITLRHIMRDRGWGKCSLVHYFSHYNLIWLWYGTVQYSPGTHFLLSACLTFGSLHPHVLSDPHTAESMWAQSVSVLQASPKSVNKVHVYMITMRIRLIRQSYIKDAEKMYTLWQEVSIYWNHESEIPILNHS